MIRRVVDKCLRQLKAQAADRKVTITAEPAVLDQLGEQGFEPLLGGRPLERLIERLVKRPLARLILFGALKQGGTAHLRLGTDGTSILVEPA